MIFESLLSKELKFLRQKLLNHPFWKQIENGTLDKRRLGIFALQDYWLTKQAIRIDCFIIASMQDQTLRQLLLERLALSVSHRGNTLFDFASGVGVTKKDFENVEPLAGCMALTTFFYWMIDYAGDLEKIVAIDASKEIFSLLCVRVQPALMKHYSLTESQVAFFTIHEGMNKRLQPVDSYIETQCKNAAKKKLVQQAIRLSYENEILFYDTILALPLD